MDDLERLKARVEGLELVVAQSLKSLADHLGPDARLALIDTRARMFPTSGFGSAPGPTEFDRERYYAASEALGKIDDLL